MLLFLGAHSIRIFADGWRALQIQRLGDGPWKGIYSLVSLAGFVLIVWGFGLAREQPVSVWSPPLALNYVAVALVLLAFVLFAAAYVPRNGIKAKVHHPMVLSVKVWAFAHLLAAGMLADIVLFGGFLAWSVACYAASRRRDRAAGKQYAAGTMSGSLATVTAGLAVWAVFAFWLHRLLFGVSPFG